MATNADAGFASRTAARGFMADQSFFARYAIVLALFIIVAFAQFSLRGFVDIRKMPPVIHAHALVMMTWLGLFVLQNQLVHRGELALHRKVGWASAIVVAAVAVLGCAVGYTALSMHMVPPIFTQPYFLSLTVIEATAFAATVAWAVSLRRRTEWHRRIMFGATFLLLEPALGRLLPMPLLGDYGEWVALLVQLVFVGVIARHDRKVLGQVHPATIACAAILIGVHSLVSFAAILPPVVSAASAVAGT
ncbi:hypothetical protein [Sphingomonas sp.]|uniref:hypothetical protein n=1 Tax=Sphingomonas sp. TaxID=28214 RepID=UPI0025CF4A80|nr:hypothetical protein [Sphingomonas sp.]MBV9528396.1 hypothetical protein [Sphingomonas sp.]